MRHKHCDAIVAWANGEQIEYRPDGQQHWTLCGHAFKPSWAEEYEYRVKPEKVYPVTQMTAQELARTQGPRFITEISASFEREARSIANAALRHAIDANQIITMTGHMDALDALGQAMKGIEISRHAQRDMAIAEAVRRAYANSANDIDLAAIIAEVA